MDIKLHGKSEERVAWKLPSAFMNHDSLTLHELWQLLNENLSPIYLNALGGIRGKISLWNTWTNTCDNDYRDIECNDPYCVKGIKCIPHVICSRYSKGHNMYKIRTEIKDIIYSSKEYETQEQSPTIDKMSISFICN